MQRSIVFLFILIALVPHVVQSKPVVQPSESTAGLSMNQQFRDAVIHYVRKTAEQIIHSQPLSNMKPLPGQWGSQYPKSYWSIHVSIYNSGNKISTGYATNATLETALIQATKEALALLPQTLLTMDRLQHFNFLIAFDYPPDNRYSVLEHQGTGLELLGNRIALRKLTQHTIQNQIPASRHFLLNIMNPEYHAFFQYYDAGNDKKEQQLRTIYTASALYSLLKMHEVTPNLSLMKQYASIADFLLSMQISEGENKGAFYYSLNASTQKKECHVEVGTASKTIFTLLLMHQLQKKPEYLNAAERAGDWLLTKIKADGAVIHGGWCANGQWRYSDKQSLLYSGQMLSALSRLYQVSKKPEYLRGANKIAGQLAAKVQKHKGLLGDNFRKANTISTSWVAMALIDYSKATPDSSLYHRIIHQTANEILAHQMNNPNDVYNFGRYLDTMTTSGNGWINEVMGELYPFCLKTKMPQCDRYRQAMILTSRWLLQNVYTHANTYAVANPEQAIGGFIRSYRNTGVRIDAVCHGLNSLISLMKRLNDQPQLLLNLGEPSFNERLGLLRIGNIHDESFHAKAIVNAVGA